MTVIAIAEQIVMFVLLIILLLLSRLDAGRRGALALAIPARVTEMALTG
jgi:hypothetical protein